MRFSTEPITSNKVALLIEYNGAHYFGWQKQTKPAVATVQAALESALAKVANHSVSVFCAGRTDARVHGCAQLVHFETSSHRSQKAWVCGVNANLPDDIAVVDAFAVADDFHARHSAIARTYRYVIDNSKVRSANFAKAVTAIDIPLDDKAMHQGAQALIGEHDFSAFRGAACQSKSPYRFVEYIQVSRQADLVVMEIKANAFVLHMVRNIVGVLLEVGRRDKPVAWVAEVLNSCDRSQAGVTAPPEGLYFVEAHYPEECAIPKYPKGPLFLRDCSTS